MNCTGIKNCNCNLAQDACSPAEPICRTPNADPPALTQGLVTEMTSEAMPLKIDPTRSTLEMTVKGSLPGDIPVSDTETTPVDGQMVLHGQPCPGSSCDMKLEIGAFPADVTFHFLCLFGVCALNEQVTHIAVGGGTNGIPIHFDSTGTATIPQAFLLSTYEVTVDGKRVRGTMTNPVPLTLVVDFNGGTFQLPKIPVSFGQQNGSGNITLAGTIANRPPVARAGTNQTLECTSPKGASATLDASASTDADGDIVQYTWWANGPFDSNGAISDPNMGLLPKLAVQAPSGTTQYALAAQDTCDPSPEVNIVNVTSSEPPNGGGQGNTATSFITSISRSRSATSFFSRAFSAASCFKRLASSTLIPSNRRFQTYSVCSETPCFLATSADRRAVCLAQHLHHLLFREPALAHLGTLQLSGPRGILSRFRWSENPRARHRGGGSTPRRRIVSRAHRGNRRSAVRAIAC